MQLRVDSTMVDSTMVDCAAVSAGGDEEPRLHGVDDIPDVIDAAWYRKHEHLLDWSADGKTLRVKTPQGRSRPRDPGIRHGTAAPLLGEADGAWPHRPPRPLRKTRHPPPPDAAVEVCGAGSPGSSIGSMCLAATTWAATQGSRFSRQIRSMASTISTGPWWMAMESATSGLILSAPY